MNEAEKLTLVELFKPSNYEINSLADEISADRCCATLLQHFHQYLLQERNIEPLTAGSQAAGADYYLREFMIGHSRLNIFSSTAELVQSFAAHWYIIRTLEPNLTELKSLLDGTASFYSFLAEKKLIDPAVAKAIASACQDDETYQQRIDSFHAISGAGFSAWAQEYPLN